MNEALSDIFAAGVDPWKNSGSGEEGSPSEDIATRWLNDPETWKLCETCGSGFPPRFLNDPDQGKSSLHRNQYDYPNVNWQTDEGKIAHGDGGIYTMAFYL